MFKHKKVSGELNTDPAKVGGEDWDDDHVISANSLVPIAIVKIQWDSTNEWIYATEKTTRAGQVTRFAAGDYRFDLYFSDIAFTPETNVGFRCVLNVNPRGPIPVGMAFSATCDSAGTVSVMTEGAGGGYVDPSIWVDYYVTVYLDVTVAQAPF